MDRLYKMTQSTKSYEGKVNFSKVKDFLSNTIFSILKSLMVLTFCFSLQAPTLQLYLEKEYSKFLLEDQEK